MKHTLLFTLLTTTLTCISSFAQTINIVPGFNTGTPVNGPNSQIYCSAQQADGKILVGGRIGVYPTNELPGLCRLNADGSQDNTFFTTPFPSNDWDPYVNCVLVQPDGKIVVGGTFSHWNGQDCSGIIRLNSDGTIDATFDYGDGFDPAGTDNVPYIVSMALQSDGKIIVLGTYDEYDGTPRNGIARLNADGSLDTGYDPGQLFECEVEGTSYPVYYISSVIQPDDKLIVCGIFTGFDGTPLHSLARVNPNGTLDVGFSTATDFDSDPVVSGGAYVNEVALQPDGKVIIAGYFTEISGSTHTSVARLLSTGAVDNTFSTSASGTGFPGNSGLQVAIPESIAIQDDGKVLIGGSFETYDGLSRESIIRFEANGDLDYGFYIEATNNEDNTVYGMIPQTNDQLFIGGRFNTLQGQNRNGIALVDVCGNYSVSEVDNCSDYLWTADNATYTISGTYTAILENENGCDSVSVLKLFIPEMADAQEICIVGLDSLTSKNRVVWEKPLSQSIDSFYVYKETTVADVYQQIGAVGYEDLGVFIDPNSNPAIQPYRYKVAILDTCGRVNDMSTTAHKTIHLTINQGVGNNWNLIWSSYGGITVPTYNIYKGTSPSTMTLLTTVQGNINSYTDLNVVGDVNYQIEFVNPNDCDPSKSINYNSCKSNITATSDLGISTNDSFAFSLSPNPSINDITLNLPSESGKISIYSMVGSIVFETEVRKLQEIISTRELASGMYRIVYSSGNHISEKRFVKHAE